VLPVKVLWGKVGALNAHLETIRGVRRAKGVETMDMDIAVPSLSVSLDLDVRYHSSIVCWHLIGDYTHLVLNRAVRYLYLFLSLG